MLESMLKTYRVPRKQQTFDVAFPCNLFAIIESTVKSGQTLNDRITELVKKGLAAERVKEAKEIAEQMQMLFDEGKFASEGGVRTRC